MSDTNSPQSTQPQPPGRRQSDPDALPTVLSGMTKERRRFPYLIAGAVTIVVVGLCLLGAAFVLFVLPDLMAGGATTGAPTSIVVDNRSGQTLCELFVAAAGSAERGGNRIAGAPLSSGHKTTLENVPAGSYDLIAVGCQANDIETRSGIALAGGQYDWVVESSGAAPTTVPTGREFDLTVVNHSTTTVCAIQLRLAQDTIWSPNQMAEGDKLAPGATYTIEAIPEGEYDVRASACGGGEAVKEDLLLDSDQEWELSD